MTKRRSLLGFQRNGCTEGLAVEIGEAHEIYGAGEELLGEEHKPKTVQDDEKTLPEFIE
jgi:hypothetical protein